MKPIKSWWLIGIVLGLIVYVWISAQCVSTGIEISRLKFRKAELLNLNRMTGAEISGLRSAERVEKMARNDLGLVIPDKFENILVPEKKRADSGFFGAARDWIANTIGYVF